MKRSIRAVYPRALCGVALLALLVTWVAPASGAKETAESGEGRESAGPPISYYATTVGRSDFEIVIVQYWSKGPLFRSETIVAGHPVITVVRGDEYFTWDNLTGVGYVVKRTPAALAADKKRSRPFGLELEEIIEDGGEKVRSETLNGIRVDVYRVTDNAGRRTLWVDAERLHLPVRLETYVRASGRKGKLDWINWVPGLVIADSFFEPRSGLDLTRYDDYESYLERLRHGPVPPTPPLFHYLLHERSGVVD